MPSTESIIQLLEKWRLGLTSEAENEQLLALLEDKEILEQLDPSFQSVWEQANPEKDSHPEIEAGIKTILQSFPSDDGSVRIPSTTPGKVVHLKRWSWVAACVLLALLIGAYFWIAQDKHKQSSAVVVRQQQPVPGKDGAVLTLANGTQLVLDSLGVGLIATQNGAKVKLENGQLVYDPAGVPTGEIAYNTMTTPRGRQFRLVLPDGTKVWLNAASSIRYPAVFDEKERSVTLSGEAYFEVVENREKPFRVNIDNRAAIEVLGTSFNVNAYDDEATINTTLITGVVRLQSAPLNNEHRQQTGHARNVVLKPGQQGQIRDDVKVVDNADIAQAIAWKNGVFNFNNLDLAAVLRQLVRWYDLELRFNGNLSSEKFRGEMPRNLQLGEVLELLQGLNVQFDIDGKMLTVKGR